ncbi:dienelactone hydrolase family protein [Arthrobacter sp. PAMC25564]|uniref:dienelactone hydrolase family protein n=1 Tax=Arthrobacter sp. PAMC25564 TaxID=2565366 RepID=UPI0010A1FFF5|nr:dienelactone hydrolase family protein [Arthrobacter sp. PAMC25564]QCB96511.1 dienelactone hydrolase family protein [Arthrobacter sp. PAMC25564]
MTFIDLTAAGTGSPNLRGYLAEPEGPGPFPAVLMIHEMFGVNDITVRQADRMAAAGYLTLAVDLFSDGGARRCLVSTMRSLVSGSGKAFTDLAVAQAWLEQSGRSNGKIGVIGFCMGGGFALLIARDGFDAAAVNYGRLPKNPDEALLGACPVVGNFGKADRTLPGAAAKLEAALDRLGIENDIKEFDGAGHAFMDDAEAGPRPLRPLFRVMGIKPDPDAAAEAWQRIEDHFAKHLKA